MPCRHFYHFQKGISLIEILVAMAIGLLLIAIAALSIQLSRQMAHLSHEITTMEQDANTALRIMGHQIRQAGAIQLSTDAHSPDNRTPWVPARMLAGVAQGQTAIASPTIPRSDSNALQVRYRNAAARQGSKPFFPQMRDCQGQNQSNGLHPTYITSTFFLRDRQLMCRGVAGIPQPVIGNVNDFSFQVLLLLPSHDGAKTHSLAYASVQEMQADASLWKHVIAVEICLEMEGGAPSRSEWNIEYANCRDEIKATAGRLIGIYRNSFHIRSPEGSRWP